MGGKASTGVRRGCDRRLMLRGPTRTQRATIASAPRCPTCFFGHSLATHLLRSPPHVSSASSPNIDGTEWARKGTRPTKFHWRSRFSGCSVLREPCESVKVRQDAVGRELAAFSHVNLTPHPVNLDGVPCVHPNGARQAAKLFKLRPGPSDPHKAEMHKLLKLRAVPTNCVWCRQA